MTSIRNLLALEINLGNIVGPGPWGNMALQGNEVTPAASAFVSIISNIIGIMTIIAGIWFIFQFIIGGYGYMTAGGDPKKMSDAAKKITSAFIGLLVVVAAYAIMSLLGKLLGFEFLKPITIIERLRP